MMPNLVIFNVSFLNVEIPILSTGGGISAHLNVGSVQLGGRGSANRAGDCQSELPSPTEHSVRLVT